MASRYDDVRHIIHIVSGEDVACALCAAWPAPARFDGTVNHYINEHGYRLLHVGSESAARGGEIAYSTVAVLGK